MKENKININSDALYSRLFTESGYISLSRSTMGIPDELSSVVQITEDDKRAIERYISSSINEVAHTISRYLSPASVKYLCDATGGTTEYAISFTLPANYPDECRKMIEEAVNDIVVDRTLQYWSMMVKPDEANIQAAKVQSNVGRLRELLSLRKYPHRNAGSNNIIEL